MERLIELLNEKHNLEWVLWSNMNWDYLFVKWDKENKFYEEQIISKKFWFIKWLVENDKIDRNRILKEDWQFRLFYYDLERVKNYDRLIMYLSVEDNPIEFLVSLLK